MEVSITYLHPNHILDFNQQQKKKTDQNDTRICSPQSPAPHIQHKYINDWPIISIIRRRDIYFAYNVY